MVTGERREAAGVEVDDLAAVVVALCVKLACGGRRDAVELGRGAWLAEIVGEPGAQTGDLAGEDAQSAPVRD